MNSSIISFTIFEFKQIKFENKSLKNSYFIKVSKKTTRRFWWFWKVAAVYGFKVF